MVNHRQNAGIAQQHFVDAARGRIAVVGGQHVGVQEAAQRRQGQGEILDQTDGTGIDLAVVLPALARGITKLEARLRKQRVQRHIQGVTDVEIFTFLTQIHRPQAHRKQRTAQGFEDLRHRLARRQFTPAMLAAQPAIARAPLVAGAAQLADDGL